MSVISSSTTTTTAYKVTADTTGTLVLQTGSTPTTAVTIDTSQNMGVGTTSPSSYNSGYGSQTVIANAGGNAGATIVSSTSGNGSIYFADGSSGDTQYRGFIQYAHADDSLKFSTAATERARIDSSGNLLVGTTSASGAKLRVYDGTIRCDSLSVNSTSAYFYQTSGAFTTGNAAKTAFYSESGVRSFGLGWLSDSGGSQAAWMTANSTNLGWVIQTDSANGVRLANTATSWSSYSDERLKNIIEEIPQALTKIAAIRAVRFSWKSDEENTPKVGVIAQDVQAVLPEVVDDDTDFMQVRYSELVPLCIKAIQEQQAIIDAQQAALETLTNRITALENK
jgi:hypothetical protein